MKQPDHPLVECGRDRIPEDNQQRRVARRNDLHRFLHVPRKNRRSPPAPHLFWRCAALSIAARLHSADSACSRICSAIALCYKAPSQTQSCFSFLSCGGFAVAEHGPPPGATHEHPESLLYRHWSPGWSGWSQTGLPHPGYFGILLHAEDWENLCDCSHKPI